MFFLQRKPIVHFAKLSLYISTCQSVFFCAMNLKHALYVVTAVFSSLKLVTLLSLLNFVKRVLIESCAWYNQICMTGWQSGSWKATADEAVALHQAPWFEVGNERQQWPWRDCKHPEHMSHQIDRPFTSLQTFHYWWGPCYISLHVDHILAWSKGGETIIENLETLCLECNLGKSNVL